MIYEEERNQLVEFVRIMFERKLTNSAGGNVSIKIDDEHYIMTPTLMSQKYHCNLKPSQILVLNNKQEIIEGNGEVTREINMHFACYHANKSVRCVLHAHPLESMFFAVNLDYMPNLTEATQKIGEIQRLDYAPATTNKLAEIVSKQVILDQSIPKAYLLSHHGVLILNKDLESAFDILERLEWNSNVAFKTMIAECLGISVNNKVSLDGTRE